LANMHLPVCALCSIRSIGTQLLFGSDQAACSGPAPNCLYQMANFAAARHGTQSAVPTRCLIRSNTHYPKENPLKNILRRALVTTAAICFVLQAPFVLAANVTLSGTQETPPVQTSASGVTDIKVAADQSVSGKITTTGITGTAAHIHLGAPGEKGGPVVILEKTSDNVWSVPAGAKLTDDQYAAYKAGKLYVNVHSEANKGGEIRAQLTP
jgi:hypothetical protein